MDSYRTPPDEDRKLEYGSGRVLGEGRIAIEIKSTDEVKSRHLKGLKAFLEDFPKARAMVSVSVHFVTVCKRGSSPSDFGALLRLEVHVMYKTDIGRKIFYIEGMWVFNLSSQTN